MYCLFGSYIYFIYFCINKTIILENKRTTETIKLEDYGTDNLHLQSV